MAALDWLPEVAAQALRLGAKRLVANSGPLGKMPWCKTTRQLGFAELEADAAGCSRATLDLRHFTPAQTLIDVSNG